MLCRPLIVWGFPLTESLPIPEEAVEAAAKVIRDNVERPTMGPTEMLEAALRAFCEEMGITVEEDHIHEPYPSFENYNSDGVAQYQARCHRCDWTGPLRAGPSRNENKNAVRAEAESHRQLAYRLCSRWFPVSPESKP
jgi:hypothetical protein